MADMWMWKWSHVHASLNIVTLKHMYQMLSPDDVIHQGATLGSKDLFLGSKWKSPRC